MRQDVHGSRHLPATVTVNALPAVPTITAGGPLTFCTGGSVILTSSAGASYLWSTGATTASITVTTTGNYTVQVTNTAGCNWFFSNLSVTVNPVPAAPTITAGGPLTLLQGECNLNFQRRDHLFMVDRCNNSSISHDYFGSYTVQVTNAAGCQSAPSAATVVTVNALPATNYYRRRSFNFLCRGSVTLTSSAGHHYLYGLPVQQQQV